MKVAEKRQFQKAAEIEAPHDIARSFLGRGSLAKVHQLSWRWQIPLGVAAACLGLLLRWAFLGAYPMMGMPYITFYPAVALAGILGGWICGGSATLASSVLAILFLDRGAHGHGAVLLGAFLLNCAIVSGLGALLHRSWAALGEAEGQRRETELEKDANERLRLANTVAAIGTFDVDLLSRTIYNDDAVSDMFGLQRGVVVSRKGILSLVSEDTRASLDEAIEQAMSTRGDGRYRSEMKIRRANDGSERVIATQGQVFFAAGKAVRMIGVCRDVTDERFAERETQQRARLAEQLTAVAGAAPGVIYSMRLGSDAWVSVPFAAPRTREVLGLEAAELIGDASAFLRRVHPADFAVIESGMLTAARELRRWSGVFRYLHPTRGQIWIESHAMASPEPNGGAIWHGYLHDVSERVRSEQALRESEQRNVAFFRNANIGAAELGPDLHYLRVNSRFCQMTGFTEEQLLTMRATDVSLPDRRAEDEEELKRHLSGERTQFQTERPFLRKDGAVIWAEVSGSLVQDAEGRPLYSVTLFSDVTERKLAEAALEKSRNRLLAIVEQAPVSIAMFDRNMDYLATSRRYVEEYGRGRKELVGLNHYELNPDLPTRWRAHHGLTLLGQYSSHDDEYWKESSGREHWFRWTLSPWTDESGEVGGVILLIEDRGQQRRAEVALLENEELLRQVGDNLPESFVYRFVRRADGRAEFLHMSAGVERIFGISAAEAVRDPELVFSRFAAASVTALREAEARSLTDFADFRIECQFRRSQGDLGWAVVRSSPRRLADGLIVQDGVCTDITRQKEIEAALEESEEKFRNAFAAASVGFVMSAQAGKIVDANAAFCDLTGYAVDELRSMTLLDLVDPDDQGDNLSAASRASAANSSAYVIETRYRRKDGNIIWVRQSASLTSSSAGQKKWLINLVEDISQRKRSEALVAGAVKRLRAVLNGAKEAIVSFDDEGVVQSINSAGLSMFGFQEEEIVGRPVLPLVSAQHEDAAHPFFFNSRASEASPLGAIEVDGRRKDGSVFPMEVSVARTEADNARIHVAFIRELSERRLIESKIEKLTAQRLSAMGGMAAALAHELNQPLATVAIYLETARHRLRTLEDERIVSARSALDRAMEQVMRAGQVVSHLREFISHGEPDKTHQSLHGLLREVGQNFGRQTGSSINLRLDLDADSDDIVVDKAQISQVVMSLLRNAREAFNGTAGGWIGIRTNIEGDSVRVTVSDNGPGIDPDIRQRLFEPLVTSKPGGKGIGLSICKSIVEAHYGTITGGDCESGGASFSFTLPLATAETLE